MARPKSGRELSFGYLAVSMLNLGPSSALLTEWHPKLRSWERDNPHLDEREWEERNDFLSALNEISWQLRQYAGLFAEVADVPELIEDGDATTTYGIRYSLATITKTTKGVVTDSSDYLPACTTYWILDQ